jgi:hypothetical protein
MTKSQKYVDLLVRTHTYRTPITSDSYIFLGQLHLLNLTCKKILGRIMYKEEFTRYNVDFKSLAGPY